MKMVGIKSGELPVGFSLDEKTGEINGIALERVLYCKVVIEAVNLSGTSSVVLRFHIKVLPTVIWISILTVLLILLLIIFICICVKCHKKKKRQLPITKPASKKKELKRQNHEEEIVPIDVPDTVVNNMVIIRQSNPPKPSKAPSEV